MIRNMPNKLGQISSSAFTGAVREALQRISTLLDTIFERAVTSTKQLGCKFWNSCKVHIFYTLGRIITIRRLVKTLLSNCTFDRGSLIPTYIRPFDLFVKGTETGDWLLRLDSNQQPSG